MPKLKKSKKSTKSTRLISIKKLQKLSRDRERLWNALEKHFDIAESFLAKAWVSEKIEEVKKNANKKTPKAV